MKIPFLDQSSNRDYAFMMEFELENIAAYNADTSNLRIQTTFRRTGSGDNQLQNRYPVILELHGRLARANRQDDIGAALGPVRELPISFSRPNHQQWIDLLFTFPMHYLQILEEERREQDIRLLLEMWGLVAIVEPRDKEQVNRIQVAHSPIEVIWFEKIETDRSNQSNLVIPRSTWIDRILPGLGYGRSVLIELPLVRTPPIPEVYRNAAKALDNARNAFNAEDYGGAVKHAREVLESLGKISSDGSGRLTSFCKEYLEPSIGETKSHAVDRSLNALRDVINASSHIDPQKPFKIDRNIAAYVIETLALNLRYISTIQ